MHIFRYSPSLPASARHSVVALGNFDGVHLGHQAVIGKAVAIAQAERAKSAILTFEPHPVMFFKPDLPPLRLTDFHTKMERVRDLGIDTAIIARFHQAFASLSAEDFIETVLHRTLQVRHVVVGHDFIFGRQRQGNPALLAAAAKQYGFGFTQLPAIGEGEEYYSSTRIREQLRTGNLTAVSRLLGHSYTVRGRVVAGARRGRQLGFPTANLALSPDLLIPALGVYAIRAYVAGTWHTGVANLGKRPTFDGETVTLEAHLFDFDGNLYGKWVNIEYSAWLRPEQKFTGIDALRAQIEADCRQARLLLTE